MTTRNITETSEQSAVTCVKGAETHVDVASLRPGERWEVRLTEEIAVRDVFYLSWSLAASQSQWVEREWRAALTTRGIDFIDPVPLEPASRIPPPPELASLHFGDWTLAYRSL